MMGLRVHLSCRLRVAMIRSIIYGYVRRDDPRGARGVGGAREVLA
jgi:hypothetical protein